MSREPITACEYAKIAEHLSHGLSYAKIGRLMGRSEDTISIMGRRIKAGLPYQQPGNRLVLSEAQRRRISRLDGQGHSRTCIAQKLRLGTKVIAGFLGATSTKKNCGCQHIAHVEAKRMEHPNCARKWQPDELATATKMLRAGASQKAVAAKLGRSVDSVQHAVAELRRKGVQLPKADRGRKLTDDDREQILAMVEDDVPREQIAARFGVSISTVGEVWRALREGGPIIRGVRGERPPRATVDIITVDPRLWSPGRARYARVLIKDRTIAEYAAAELSREFPHLPPVSAAEFCAFKAEARF